MSEGDEYIFVYYFCIIWFYPDIKQFLLHPVLCDEFCVQIFYTHTHSQNFFDITEDVES